MFVERLLNKKNKNQKDKAGAYIPLIDNILSFKNISRVSYISLQRTQKIEKKQLRSDNLNRSRFISTSTYCVTRYLL
jgi:hypothetical protein